MGNKKIVLTKTVHYNGKDYPPGEEQEWPEAVTTGLIEKNAAEPVFHLVPEPNAAVDTQEPVAEPDAAGTESAPDDGVVNMEDLILAAGEAAKNDLVTEAGKPEVKAMAEILGYAVTSAQRDEAWEILKKEQG